MKDLFGHDIPDNPPMDAPLPWVLWRVEFPDFPKDAPEYWLAQTNEQMTAAYAAHQRECDWPSWRTLPRFNVYAVTAQPEHPRPVDHRIYFERMTDGQAAAVFAETTWRPDAPCYFCGGDE